jgi:MFS family permease
MSLQPADSSSPRPAHLLRGRNFQLLWGGEFISLLGEQFFLVALPWLVLLLTGNAFATGTVLAVAAAPRAVLILLGGALIDRFSPRAIMIYSSISRMILLAVFALLTAGGWVDLWMLYVLGLLLGLAYAIYLPAQSAIIPRLVSRERLHAGNAIIQGTFQLARVMGPILAGICIAILGNGGTGADAIPKGTGIGIVFALNAASFLISAITLAMITLPARHRTESGEAGSPALADADACGIFRSLGQGLAGVWRDSTLRLYLVLIGVVNLALLGPLSVGIPVLAHTRYNGGGFEYGAILAGLGAGALTGVIAGGTLRRPPGRAFPGAMLGSCAMLGVGLLLLGTLPTAPASTAAAFIIGIAEGYMVVMFITWLQLRTSKAELGRMMGVLLFASVGQAPLSNLIAGALVGVSVLLAMVLAGGLIVVVVAVAAFRPCVWRLGDTRVVAARVAA